MENTNFHMLNLHVQSIKEVKIEISAKLTAQHMQEFGTWKLRKKTGWGGVLKYERGIYVPRRVQK